MIFVIHFRLPKNKKRTAVTAATTTHHHCRHCRHALMHSGRASCPYIHVSACLKPAALFFPGFLPGHPISSPSFRGPWKMASSQTPTAPASGGGAPPFGGSSGSSVWIPGLGKVEVLAFGSEEMLCRPCVDCGTKTGRFCDFCTAKERLPEETWASDQQGTPLCSKCEGAHGMCWFCRGAACVDCGRETTNWCNHCFVLDHYQEYFFVFDHYKGPFWSKNQRTPLCTQCKNIHSKCGHCRERPCVDCGRVTTNACGSKLCHAERHPHCPGGPWSKFQRTPLCSECKNKHEICWDCRNQKAWVTPPPWREDGSQ